VLLQEAHRLLSDQQVLLQEAHRLLSDHLLPQAETLLPLNHHQQVQVNLHHQKRGKGDKNLHPGNCLKKGSFVNIVNFEK
jgi:hypothetical protein